MWSFRRLGEKWYQELFWTRVSLNVSTAKSFANTKENIQIESLPERAVHDEGLGAVEPIVKDTVSGVLSDIILRGEG